MTSRPRSNVAARRARARLWRWQSPVGATTPRRDQRRRMRRANARHCMHAQTTTHIFTRAGDAPSASQNSTSVHPVRLYHCMPCTSAARRATANRKPPRPAALRNTNRERVARTTYVRVACRPKLSGLVVPFSVCGVRTFRLTVYAMRMWVHDDNAVAYTLSTGTPPRPISVFVRVVYSTPSDEINEF